MISFTRFIISFSKLIFLLMEFTISQIALNDPLKILMNGHHDWYKGPVTTISKLFLFVYDDYVMLISHNVTYLADLVEFFLETLTLIFIQPSDGRVQLKFIKAFLMDVRTSTCAVILNENSRSHFKVSYIINKLTVIIWARWYQNF